MFSTSIESSKSAVIDDWSVVQEKKNEIMDIKTTIDNNVRKTPDTYFKLVYSFNSMLFNFIINSCDK